MTACSERDRGSDRRARRHPGGPDRRGRSTHSLQREGSDLPQHARMGRLAPNEPPALAALPRRNRLSPELQGKTRAPEEWEETANHLDYPAAGHAVQIAPAINYGFYVPALYVSAAAAREDASPQTRRSA